MFLTKDQIYGILRHVLTTAGGALVAKGVVDEAMMLEGVGIVMSIVGFAWSYISKKNAEATEATEAEG